MSGWKAVGAAIAGLVIVVLVAGLTDLDMLVQQRLFDSQAGLWLVDQGAFLPRLLLYNFPRVFLAALLLASIWLLARPAHRQAWGLSTRQTGFLVCALALVPASANLAKHYSGVPCPYQLEQFGGARPHVPLHRALSSEHDRQAGHCWPSGHASSGFALLSLAFVAPSRRGRRRMLLLSLSAGLVTGSYQVLKGAHFPSHVLATLFLAWLVCVLLAAIFRIGPGHAPATP